MANLKDVIYLSAEDYNTLYTNGTVTINGVTLTYDANNVYIVPDNTQQQIDNILALIPSDATSSNKLATVSDIPTVPTNVSAFNNDAGYTTNTGTITGITMNGASKGTSGVVDLGTVITAHQDISGKANKASITAGTAGTSSATSGSTLAVPYVTMNAQGIVTGYGTHTHTVTGFLTSHQSLAAYTPTSSLPSIGIIAAAATTATYLHIMGPSNSLSNYNISSNNTYKFQFSLSKRYILIPVGNGGAVSTSSTADGYGITKIAYSGNTNSSYTSTGYTTTGTASNYAKIVFTMSDSSGQPKILVIGY